MAYTSIHCKLRASKSNQMLVTYKQAVNGNLVCGRILLTYSNCTALGITENTSVGQHEWELQNHLVEMEK